MPPVESCCRVFIDATALSHTACAWPAAPTDGVPKLKWIGSEGEYNAMVVELLGPSLTDVFNACGQRFSLKTVLLLADQMVRCHTVPRLLYSR